MSSRNIKHVHTKSTEPASDKTSVGPHASAPAATAAKPNLSGVKVKESQNEHTEKTTGESIFDVRDK